MYLYVYVLVIIVCNVKSLLIEAKAENYNLYSFSQLNHEPLNTQRASFCVSQQPSLQRWQRTKLK